MTPAELLIALHNISDPELVKQVVQATNLCFKEKSMYTHEVLVTVLGKAKYITLAVIVIFDGNLHFFQSFHP